MRNKRDIGFHLSADSVSASSISGEGSGRTAGSTSTGFRFLAGRLPGRRPGFFLVVGKLSISKHKVSIKLTLPGKWSV